MTPADLSAADQTPLQQLGQAELTADVVVVGAGIVGLSCALLLQRQGRVVLLLDRQGIAAEASRGNAGAYAFSDVLPMASHCVLAKTRNERLRFAGAVKIGLVVTTFLRSRPTHLVAENLPAYLERTVLGQRLLPIRGAFDVRDERFNSLRGQEVVFLIEVT